MMETMIGDIKLELVSIKIFFLGEEIYLPDITLVI